MASVLEITCDCGYRAEVAEGGVFSGVVDLFVCDDCREVVDLLVWRSGGEATAAPPGQVELRCDRCNGACVRAWRDGDGEPGRCPRCDRAVTLRTAGIAD